MLRRTLYLVLGFIGMLAVVAGAWFAGYYTRDRVRAASPGSLGVAGDYALLKEAQSLLDQYYLREQPPPAVREYGAIRGLLTAIGDRFTFFIEPPVAASESNVLAGRYGGIGVQLKRDAAARWVLYPFLDSPAYIAGVRDGDVLVSVNDAPIPPALGPDAVDQLLRGEVKGDNGVTIGVQRASAPVQTYKIVFAEIAVPSLTWRALVEAPQIGYIQLMRFSNRTPEEVKAAIAGLTALNVKALVLDLRNNPGGLLDECVTVAGQFVNGGVIFIEKTRDGTKEYTAPDNSALTGLPLVVIVNGGTASASELVAGALRDRGRAILVGQKTYGKGSVQLILQLPDKSSMHVTNAEWLPPSKNRLDGVGLLPEIVVEPDASGKDAELMAAITHLSK